MAEGRPGLPHGIEDQAARPVGCRQGQRPLAKVLERVGSLSSLGHSKAGSEVLETADSTRTLQRQAPPVALRLPRSSQRTSSWAGDRRKAPADWVRMGGSPGILGMGWKRGVISNSTGYERRWSRYSLVGLHFPPGWMGLPSYPGAQLGGDNTVTPRQDILFPTCQPRQLLFTFHSDGRYSLGHRHHRWLGRLCPGSKCLRICGDQMGRIEG